MSNKTMVIGNKVIGEDNPVFIIAEVGNNHNGSLSRAKQLVDASVDAGVDAVKFQMRNMDALYGDAHKSGKDSVDLGAQYTLDLLAKYQLSNDEMFEVFDYCKQKSILAFCTPWDEPSVDALESYGIPFYKVASADLTNHRLLKYLASKKKPLICSTGMSTEEEIKITASLLSTLGASFAFLHCNSTYPTPFKDVNLAYLSKLRTIAPIVGYSGHERGIHVPIAAVALGATIIEKHITLDKSLEGVDHKVSLLPDEFKSMVHCIRDVELALKNPEMGAARKLSQGEMMNRENLAKSVVAARAISKGQIISDKDLDVKSPGQGLAPYYLEDLIGANAKRTFKAGEQFFASDLPNAKESKPKDYKFSRPWGLPIRHHDVRKFLGMARPDFIEFHLSYADMELNPQTYLDRDENLDFTVHAPELFAGDHLVDLCSTDRTYHKLSMDNMRRVIDVAIELKRFYPKTVKPFIIASIGGFTTDRPLTAEERKPLYARLFESLEQLKVKDVEVVPQTTAPFPWHMGGQQYQNLLLYPEECAQFCSDTGYRLTLDVSHSYLACNQLKINPKHFFETTAPHTAHLHMGDSKGVDGEGIQIGEGEIDFKLLTSIFNKLCPKAWFIPEIWQGHKNHGEGFWVALDRLNGML